MSLDISGILGAVRREVTVRDHDGRPARVLVATRVYPTSPDDLWDALTDPERIPRWFLPVSGDFRVGGHFAFEGNASGDITTREPPTHLAVTWGMHGQVSWVDVTLAPEGAGTRLRLEHVAHVPEDMWDQFGPGAVGVGWEGALLGLDQYLGPGTPTVDPTTAAAWMATDEGKSFMRTASLLWRDAHVASGEDPSTATACASRVAAFYTGEDSPGGFVIHAFDVIGDPVRRRILEALADGERQAGDLADLVVAEFGISRPAVSQHLRVLREAAFVHVRVDGSRRLYTLDPTPLQAVDLWLDRFRDSWSPRLEALATEVARGKRKRRKAGEG